MNYADMTTDDLGSYFSDYHKSIHGFRPRWISMNDREGLIEELNRLDRYMEVSCSTEQGRAELRANGWRIPFEYGDKLNVRGTLYRVVFTHMEGEAHVGYDIEPLYRSDLKGRYITCRELSRLLDTTGL